MKENKNICWEGEVSFLRSEVEENNMPNFYFNSETESIGSQIKEENDQSKNNKTIPNNKFKVHHFFSPKSNENNQTKTIKSLDESTIKKKKNNKVFISRKRNRKFDKDNIVKKVKSRFFKQLTKMLNARLLNVFNKKSIKFFSHDFIKDTTKETNNQIWKKTFSDFLEEKIIEKNKKEVLEYLKKDKIGVITLEEIYNEFLNSKEFEESIPYDEDDENYINEYIDNAKNLINYFQNKKTKTSNLFIEKKKEVQFYADQTHDSLDYHCNIINNNFEEFLSSINKNEKNIIYI